MTVDGVLLSLLRYQALEDVAERTSKARLPKVDGRLKYFNAQGILHKMEGSGAFANELGFLMAGAAVCATL